jgi:hypothetical protein
MISVDGLVQAYKMYKGGKIAPLEEIFVTAYAHRLVHHLSPDWKPDNSVSTSLLVTFDVGVLTINAIFQAMMLNNGLNSLSFELDGNVIVLSSDLSGSAPPQ